MRYGIDDGLGQQFFCSEVESKTCAVLANFGFYEYS